MTRPSPSFSRLATVTVLVIVTFGGVLSTATQAEDKLTRKELKTLASAPGGHRRLAAYYRDKAQKLSEKAQKFAAQADYLATQPATIESKQGIGCNCTSHYRYFSKLYAQEAKDAEAWAVQHERLAQE